MRDRSDAQSSPGAAIAHSSKADRPPALAKVYTGVSVRLQGRFGFTVAVVLNLPSSENDLLLHPIIAIVMVKSGQWRLGRDINLKRCQPGAGLANPVVLD